MSTATTAPPSPPNAPPIPLRTEKQAAEYLGTTPGTLSVWRCTRQVKIPFIKIGKAVRYKQSDLDAFIEANRRAE